MRLSHLIIDLLVRQGLHYFCLAPGSRCTPLALAIAEHPQAETMVHFDERGVSFHALGYAKAQQKPAVMISTSGSAVGNLLPAIMEAHHSRIPLILLTADRPQELRDNGSNQTSDQVKLFRDFARWQIELPCSDPHLPEAYISSTIAQAVYRSVDSPKGPVHINCMFREPFSFDIPPPSSTQTTTHYELSRKTLSSSTLDQWAEKISQCKKGIIIAGAGAAAADPAPIYALAESLDWPVFPDIISGCRSYGDHTHAIAHYELILKLFPEIKADTVLHLGDRFVSKPLLEGLSPSLYCLVADHPFRHDPKHNITDRIECDPSDFCAELAARIAPRSDWAAVWKEMSHAIAQQLDPYFSAKFSEPGLFRFLQNHLPKDWALFIANSMPIRDADVYYCPKQPTGPIFASRGVSGIDGNIATVIGLAQGLKRPTLAVIGDQTALHDLNSLAQLKKAEYPVVFVIINNYGSGIFSFLPVAQRTDIFEEYFAAAHTLNFKSAAELFDLPYYKGDEALTYLFSKPAHSCLVEINTDRQENLILHREIVATLKKHICAPLSFCTAS